MDNDNDDINKYNKEEGWAGNEVRWEVGGGGG